MLPVLGGTGPTVDPLAHVEPGTALWVVVSGILAAAGFVFLLFSVYGAMIAVALAIVNWFAWRRARLILRASALRAGPAQFAPIHACASAYAKRLGLHETPEVYVVDMAEVNGFALRFGKRNVILLTDETVAASLEGGSPGALSFVIAHEMAHIALGHHQWWRSPLRRVRKLSRLDELSADNVACALVGNPQAAEEGLLLLAVGPRLLTYVDRGAALAQAREIVDDKPTKRAERYLTHPVTLRRLERVLSRFSKPQQALRKAA
jgi:Zn-dependent protease with chaperone function